MVYFKANYGNWEAWHFKGLRVKFQINKQNVCNICDSISLSAL